MSKKLEAIFAMQEQKKINKFFRGLLNHLEERGYSVKRFAPCRALSEMSKLPRLVTPEGYVVTGIKNIEEYANKLNKS